MSNITINSLPTASTIDATNDLLPIYTNSLVATQAISRNTYLNLSSQPVGLTDSQTLTNKTLTSPTINGATLSGTLAGTYTIGGTPTFPSSVTQNTVVQTLTNKTLTSPTINSPTITNATINADTITGYTTSNSGTIYGISVTTGNVSMSGTLAVTGTLSSGAITSSGIIKASSSNPVWQYLGYAQITGNFTTTNTSDTYVTGLGVAVTIPTGVTKVRVTVYSSSVEASSSGQGGVVKIWSGASVGTLTNQLQQGNQVIGSTTVLNSALTVTSISSPSAGPLSYSASLFSTNGSSTVTFVGGSTNPAFILVECC